MLTKSVAGGYCLNTQTAMAMRGLFAFDTETVGDPHMRCFVPSPKPVLYEQHPGNMKKEATILGWMAREAEAREMKYQDALSRMPLDMDFAQIKSIAWMYIDRSGNAYQECALADGHEEEAILLDDFWRAIVSFNPIRVCGYNILGFDLPVLYRRSWVLGSKPVIYPLRRYSTFPVLDLMQVLYNWGSCPLNKSHNYRSLKAVCEMYGIENPLPDLHGGVFEDMDDDMRIDYNMNDTRMTWELAKRMFGYYWNNSTP